MSDPLRSTPEYSLRDASTLESRIRSLMVYSQLHGMTDGAREGYKAFVFDLMVLLNTPSETAPFVCGWIATGPNKETLHFALHDGWKVEHVLIGRKTEVVHSAGEPTPSAAPQVPAKGEHDHAPTTPAVAAHPSDKSVSLCHEGESHGDRYHYVMDGGRVCVKCLCLTAWYGRGQNEAKDQRGPKGSATSADLSDAEAVTAKADPRHEHSDKLDQGLRRGIWNAVTLAVRAIETRVDQLDKLADENAAEKDYSSASSQQKSAVDLHCAVAIIKNALVPHTHGNPGFRSDLDDVCEGCAYEKDSV
jgi:hypothetical protein